MVTRALPSGKQPSALEQAVQSRSSKEPDDCVHVPSGQMVHAVFSDSLFHEPSGHEVQTDSPLAALYLPWGQWMHTLWFACPTAGW